MKFDIKEIKEKITPEQIYDLLAEMGAEPIDKGDVIMCKTICHNCLGEGTHKLYYYKNTKLFHCYTECGDSMDVVSLFHKVQARDKEGYEIQHAVKDVAQRFGFAPSAEQDGFTKRLKDWEVFDHYNKIANITDKKIIELKTYDDAILKYLPRPIIQPWIEEGIAQNVMNIADICYDPVNQAIIIPHYDINKKLIGIRARTLVEENEKYGKYMPAILNGKMYNHPLSFNLYNLWHSKYNIQEVKKAVVFESEKGALAYSSFFGLDNDISVACCGSNLITYQVELLRNLGVQEIIIAFDRQFKELNDKECIQWTKKLTDIHNKYKNKVLISFMFDRFNDLGYKMSPIDAGPDIFMKMFKERVIL